MTSRNTHNRIIAYYTITGAELVPGEVTRRTRLTPSRVWNRGEIRHAATGKIHENSGWGITSRLGEAESVTSHLVDLLTQLDAASEVLAELAVNFKAYLTIVIYAHEFVPEMTFDRDVLAKLAALRVEANIDFYCLVDDEMSIDQAGE
ncbi:MAG: DUF4279 domain-containing protein [Acidobacteria bacterium]|nr:DUF4279 domain-containing protein [Acidobacteriota bacterium]